MTHPRLGSEGKNASPRSGAPPPGINATKNRQTAAKPAVPQTDAMLVVGAQNSSNSNRVVAVACQAGSYAFWKSDKLKSTYRENSSTT